MDHIGVKIYARPGARVDWPSLIPVFHRWIQQGVFADILPVDVADYSHVPMGPGVLLIGHHASISLDERQGRLGVLYLRKTAMPGGFDEKVRHSYDSAVAAARQLEREFGPDGGLAFDDSMFEIFINDRLLAPNSPQTWAELRPELERLYPDSVLDWKDGTRELFRVKVRRSGAAAPA